MAAVVVVICLMKIAHHPLIPDLPLQDSDDVMRMLQVLTWRDGGDWYDLTQHRINPPAGLAMHWARPPDLPLLAVLVLAEPWLGRPAAIHLTVILVPLLLALVYFAAFVWAARPLTGRAANPQAGLIALTTSLPLMVFSAGRIDHHGWQLILALLMAGDLLRLASGRRRLPLVAGCSAALGLWIGAEAIPPFALTTIGLVILWWREGRWAARHLAHFGVITLAAVLLILPLALAPGQRLSTWCDAFSLVSVALVAAVALLGLGAVVAEHLSGTLTPSRRLLVTLLIALPLLGLLGRLFPPCLAGPYGELAPEVSSLIANTAESHPLGLILVQDPVAAAYLLVLPLVSLVLVIWRLLQGSPTRRSLWLALGVLVAGGFLLTWWQMRGGFLANLYSGLSLTWLAARMGILADQTRGLWQRLALRVGPAMLVALAPHAAAAVVANWIGGPRAAEPEHCNLAPVLAVLNQSPYREGAPLLIAAPVFRSAEILWGTPHAVLAGPYHRDTEGLRDNEAILNQDEDTARATVTRRGVALLLLCPPGSSPAPAGTQGVDRFQDRLMSSNLPAWLERVPVDGQALLLRVRDTGSTAASDTQAGAKPTVP